MAPRERGRKVSKREMTPEQEVFLRELFMDLICELVDFEDEIQVEYTMNGTNVQIDVSSNPEDVRYLLGARGSVAWGLRSVMGLIYNHYGHKITLDFNRSRRPDPK